jgi:hypothetical protein
MVPTAIDPSCMRARRLHIGSRNPHIASSIPAVIAGMPGPVGMFMGRWRNSFNWTRRRWSNTDDDLGARNTCGQQKAASGGEEYFLHRAISLLVQLIGRHFQFISCCEKKRNSLACTQHLPLFAIKNPASHYISNRTALTLAKSYDQCPEYSHKKVSRDERIAYPPHHGACTGLRSQKHTRNYPS